MTDDDLPCGDCGARMVLRDSRYGKFYGCSRYPECRGTHGAHPDGTPLGIPADAETRAARMAAHEALSEVMESREMSTGEAYQWLAEQVGRPRGQVHIGVFTKEECAKVVEACEREVG